MNKRIITIIVILVIVAAMVWRLASNKKKIDEASKPKVKNTNISIPVTTETIALKEVSNQLIKTGNLIPFKEADITALSSGKLTAVNFNLGTRVSAGATVATVDSRTLELNLQQAQLTKAKAEKDYKRYETLLQGEATTEVTFQDAKLNAQNASTQIELLQKQIADNHIKSPISGQVVSKQKEAGEFVATGTVLGHVVDISRLKVDVLVSEADVYTIKNGDKVTVTSDIFPGKTITGSVYFISNQGDAAHNYKVEILLNNTSNEALKAGTFVNVDFSKSSAEKLISIPRNALVDGVNNAQVYVVENGKATLRKIILGKEMSGRYEVLDGLQAGEQVITGGQINLTNGSSVNVSK